MNTASVIALGVGAWLLLRDGGLSSILPGVTGQPPGTLPPGTLPPLGTTIGPGGTVIGPSGTPLTQAQITTAQQQAGTSGGGISTATIVGAGIAVGTAAVKYGPQLISGMRPSSGTVTLSPDGPHVGGLTQPDQISDVPIGGITDPTTVTDLGGGNFETTVTTFDDPSGTVGTGVIDDGATANTITDAANAGAGQLETTGQTPPGFTALVKDITGYLSGDVSWETLSNTIAASAAEIGLSAVANLPSMIAGAINATGITSPSEAATLNMAGATASVFLAATMAAAGLISTATVALAGIGFFIGILMIGIMSPGYYAQFGGVLAQYIAEKDKAIRRLKDDLDAALSWTDLDTAIRRFKATLNTWGGEPGFAFGTLSDVIPAPAGATGTTHEWKIVRNYEPIVAWLSRYSKVKALAVAQGPVSMTPFSQRDVWAFYPEPMSPIIFARLVLAAATGAFQDALAARQSASPNDPRSALDMITPALIGATYLQASATGMYDVGQLAAARDSVRGWSMSRWANVWSASADGSDSGGADSGADGDAGV